MSKLTDSVLAKGTAYAGHSPVSNLRYGGQDGQTSAIGRKVGGANMAEWINNQSYVRQNLIPVTVDYPKAFDLLPNSANWIEAYDAIMTLHPLTIGGISSGLTAEFSELELGGGGNVQEDLLKVSRARTALSKTYRDKGGKAIQKYIDLVMRYLYEDPDLGRPLISTLVSAADMDKLGTWTPDMFTGTHLYIEPDVTQRYVVDAWLCTNVMFKSNGDRTGGRDLRSARSVSDLSIDFTSITLNNEAVLVMADGVLAGLNLTATNPDLDMVVPSANIAQALKDAAVNFGPAKQTA